MIKCTNEDKELLLDILKKDASENCFFIGDIENFSLEEDFCSLWKSEDINETILLRYFNSFLVTRLEAKQIDDVVEIINENINTTHLSGLTSYIEQLLDLIPHKRHRKFFMAELTQESFNGKNSPYELQRAIVDDIDALFDFQLSIEEFSLTEARRKEFGQEIRTNTGRTYFLKENNSIISNATITAENSCNGMIIGVATSPNHRKKGYAEACVTRLCKEMTDEGKSVLLFYDNPDAGKLYKKIGFKDINHWSLVEL